MDELLNGRYELGEIVGSGGMGAVHRAIDTRLGRTVAIKVLRGGALADEVARARMRSEARLASSIHHPGVAQVFDYDAASASHDGMSFIVMEYVDGHSLAQLLREHGPMPVDQVMSVVQQVADALAAAHTAGVIHRDLKPANIMLTPAGRTVLVDFGIAQSAASDPLTDTGTLLGTADYFSPEQAAGRPASVQSDLYSLGVVAHHCLTGRSPFRRENHIATALAHLNDELPPLDPSVPVAVRRLVEHLAEKSPFDRPASATEVSRAASSIGAAPSVDMPPTLPGPGADEQPTATGPLSSVLPTVVQRERRSRRPLAMFSAAGLAAALIVVGLGHFRSDAAPQVPDVVGMDISDAVDVIHRGDLPMRRTTADIPGKPSGEVVQQSPAPGRALPDDGRIDLTVASGKVGVSADGIVGTTYTKAAAALEKLGFLVARQDVERSSSVGEVVAVDKSGRVPDGSTITLSVAVPAPAAGASPATATTATSAAKAPTTSAGSAQGKGQKATGSTNGKGNGKGKKK